MMEVRVVDVKRWAGRRLTVELDAEAPGTLRELSDWPVVGRITGSATVDNGGDFLELTISGTVALRAQCVRCLGPAPLDVNWALEQEFREVEPGLDDEWLCYRQDVIELDDLVTEAILLATPGAPLCSPDCAGLCAQCGQNLNDGPCGCAVEDDPRWADLEAWRPNRKSEEDT